MGPLLCLGWPMNNIWVLENSIVKKRIKKCIMHRRKFVNLGAGSICALPLMGSSFLSALKYEFPQTKPQWLVDLIHLNDESIKQMAAHRINNSDKKYFGGYMNEDEIPNPHSTSGFINVACAAFSCAESANYLSSTLLHNIDLALQALLKMQHTDGTIDLFSTNFHSTPDTAFMVKRLVQAYKLLKQSPSKEVSAVLIHFEKFLKQAGDALTVGGIHTPNHRWVVCAALTKVNELWPNPKYTNRVNEWLGEHIDLDPDGQYTEKSTYGYSGVIDRVLITVAKGLQKPELYDAVRKNIKMMRYYIHPNGEVVTEASNRQDKCQIGTMENYYYPCRYLALMDNDGEMAAICRSLEKTSPRSLLGYLNYFLEDPFLWKELPAEKPLPISYIKSFPYSGVVRIRRGDWDTTILSNNPSWLTFHKGDSVLQAMLISCSFFGKGQFQSSEILQKGNTWVMNKKLDGPYYQPYPKDKIAPDGDMDKMPRTNRKQSEVQHLETNIIISESNNGISIDIDMNGTDEVPVSLELIFRKGGQINGVESVPQKTDAYLLTGKSGSYTVGKDTIHFGPGKAEHKWLVLRGALPAMEAPTVYITGFTPFKQTIQLT